jgi:ABC-type cobalt transport system substrate-binding protein
MNNKSFRSEFLKTMVQLATAGFAFVAALAWNEVIRKFIDKFIAPGSGFISSLIYAIFVTFIAVLVAYYLGRLTQEAHQEEEKKEKKDF